MNPLTRILFLVAGVLVVSASPRNGLSSDGQPLDFVEIDASPVRTWVDSFDFVFDGSLAAMQGSMVYLTVDNNQIEIPLATLTQPDIEFVKDRLSNQGQLHFFPGQVVEDRMVSQMQLTGPEWNRQIQQWAKEIDSFAESPDAATNAWHKLRSVRDESAVERLEKHIARERSSTTAKACVEAIAGIGGPQASIALVRLAVSDERSQVRASALWGLREKGDSPTALLEIARLLRVPATRNNAYFCLRTTCLLRPLQAGERPHKEVLNSLIQLLTLTSADWVPVFLWQHRRLSATRWAGRSTWRQIPIFSESPNADALQTLQDYTHQNFGYNRRAWREWSDAQAKSQNEEARDDSPGLK